MQITNKLPLSPAPTLLSPVLIFHRSCLKAVASTAVGRCQVDAARDGGDRCGIPLLGSMASDFRHAQGWSLCCSLRGPQHTVRAQSSFRGTPAWNPGVDPGWAQQGLYGIWELHPTSGRQCPQHCGGHHKLFTCWDAPGSEGAHLLPPGHWNTKGG